MKCSRKRRFIGVAILFFGIAFALFYVLRDTQTVENLAIEISKPHRYCYYQEPGSTEDSAYDYAFVDLKVDDDIARAEMNLIMPNIPVISGMFNGSYDSSTETITGTYSGKFDGVDFNEERVARITSDGFIFTTSIEELDQSIQNSDLAYLIPSISCERFDENYLNIVGDGDTKIDTLWVE